MRFCPARTRFAETIAQTMRAQLRDKYFCQMCVVQIMVIVDVFYATLKTIQNSKYKKDLTSSVWCVNLTDKDIR